MSSFSALNSLLGGTSSAIDISSILQAMTGASSPGIDVTSAVNAAITAARAPENQWQNEQQLLQSQVSALNTIQTHAGNLDNDMQNLNSVVGPLSARTVTSSNPNLVTASAASGTTPGNHVVTVNALATIGAWTTKSFSSATATMPAGSFTITANNGASHTITTTGTETLTDVANQINGYTDLGLTARVVTDATGSRLVLVANASGSAADFSVGTISGDFGLAQSSPGNNSSVTVDGVTYTNTSNTVAVDSMPGVKLNLMGSAPGVNVSLNVAPDTAQATNAINQFVSDYNTLISDLTAQFTFNGTSEGVLATDSSIRNLQSTVLGALGYTYSPASGTTAVSNLTSLGISVGNDGKLSVDSSALQNALQGNIGDVQSFFQGTSANGFANMLDQELTSFTSPSDGAFTVDLQSITGQISDLQNSINNFETNYITPLKTQLQAEYSQAEILLQQLPMQMQQINTELGYNNAKQ